MAIRLSDEDIEELCGSDVVWVHQVSRGNEFRVASLTEDSRDELIENFGASVDPASIRPRSDKESDAGERDDSERNNSDTGKKR